MPTYNLEPIARAICAHAGYEYKGPVGAGAFKETFEAREGDIVHALKVYRPGAATERVEREIDAMLTCNHPNIGRLRRVETIVVEGAGSCLYSVEEFLSGGTLATRVATKGLLSRDEAFAIAELLVSAVAHIAANGLVHRDIKLDNVMLRADGQTPVIVDFGLVRTLRETSLTGTWEPRGPGTPYFSPPEQLCNEKALIDWRADQFSLGVALAIATFGQHPYALAANESPADVVSRVAARGPLPTAFVETARRHRLVALVRMAAPWPVQRYRTPEALTSAWRAQREDV